MENKPTSKVPTIVQALIPLIALGLMLSIFAFGNPLAMFRPEAPLEESLHFERVEVIDNGFRLTVVNDGAAPVTVAQVSVDDAYWEYTITPSNEIPRYGRATITIPYMWVKADPSEIFVITSTGLIFNYSIDLNIPAPTPGLNEFLAYGLLGVYVGIIPVLLGMLWFPAMRRMGRKWLGAILALTIGLLVFLLIDTLFEALEVAANLPSFLDGTALVIFTALLTWLLISAVGSRSGSTPKKAIYIATLIAISIGLHNLGEGLAIGAAFALGEAALGSFLVIGFTMHNITEGIGIVAPLVTKDENDKRPSLLTFALLALLAGGPAILGAWIGGFAYSPLLATIFLGVGLGAIWQVIVEVGGLLRKYAAQENTPLVSWANLGGFVVGLGLMYVTALVMVG